MTRCMINQHSEFPKSWSSKKYNDKSYLFSLSINFRTNSQRQENTDTNKFGHNFEGCVHLVSELWQVGFINFQYCV